jgi:tight adherence protein C
MNEFLVNLVVGGLWAVCAFTFAWFVANGLVEIRYITLADGRQSSRRLPLLFKFALPFAANLKFLNKPGYRKIRDVVQKDLVASGYDTLLTPQQFLSLKILVPVLVGPLLCAFLAFSLSKFPDTKFWNGMRDRQVLFYLVTLALLYIHPVRWLRDAVHQRHRSMERALPFVLDLLTLSVEAGLDFITALKRIIERRNVDPLGEELIRAMREMQVGKTRKEALKDMAERCNQQDIKSVVSSLIQADELGVSIGSILRIQADQMRVRRFQRAEKLGNEAPVKLLFPLVCFIFPAVFLVLLGPIIIEMMQKGL